MITAGNGPRMYRILIFLFFVSLFFLALAKLEDTDAWTHLSFGRIISEQHGLPEQEPFTYPSQNKPAVYYSWLFGYALYRAFALLGSTGVILLKICIVFAAFLVLYRDSLRPRKRVFISLAVLSVVALMARHRFVERPDIILMAALPFTIYALNAYVYEGKKYLYWLPLVQLIWANAHASFIFQFIPFGAFLAGGVLQLLFSRKNGQFALTPTPRQIRIIAFVFLASFAATFITPYGLDHYRVHLTFQQSSWWKDEIKELQRPNWETFKSLYYFVAVFLSVLFAEWVIAYKKRKKDLSATYPSLIHLLFLAPFLYLAFSALRFIFILVIVGGPILARSIAAIYESMTTKHPVFFARFSGSRMMMIVFPAWLAFSTGLTVNDVSPFGNDGRTFGIGTNYTSLPEKALRYMDMRSIVGNIFNEYGWGGYIAWRDYPRRKAFVDGRGYLAPDLLEKYNNALPSEKKLDELSQQYDFEVILTSIPELEREMAELYSRRDAAVASPQWALVYWDDVAMVYVKRGGRYSSVIEQDEYHVLKPPTMLANALLLSEAGDEEGLINELQRTIDSTGSAKALYMMGALHNIHGRYPEAIRTLTDARLQEREEAVVKRNVNNGLGFAYFSLGDMKEAIRYYERSNRVVEDAETYYNIGSAYLYSQKADLNRAIASFERAIKLKPGLTHAYRGLATSYRRLGMQEKAAEAEQALLLAQSDSAAKEHFQNAIRYYREKRPREAIEEYRKSIEMNPNNPVAYSNLGFLYYDIYELDRSLYYQQKALELDPQYANAHYGMAIVFTRMREVERARTHWKEYLKLEPSGYYARRAKEELALLEREKK